MSFQTSFQHLKRLLIDDEDTNYVVCTTCNDKQLHKYDTKLGSASLNKHLASAYHCKKPDEKQLSMKSFMSKPVPLKAKQKLSDAIAAWCASDKRPFNVVESDTFISMIDVVIKSAAQHGSINAKELVPTADTVKNHLVAIEETLKQKLEDYMQMIEYVNVITDHWTEKYSGKSYMTICIQYVNRKSRELENRIIGTFEVVNKTAKTTWNHFKDKLIKLKLDSKVRIVVTDNASYMSSAFGKEIYLVIMRSSRYVSPPAMGVQFATKKRYS